MLSFILCLYFFFFSSRRRHTRLQGDWSSDVCSSDLNSAQERPEPRVSSQVVEQRPCLEVGHPMGALLAGPVEPGKCLILVAEPGIDQRNAKRRHILDVRSLLESLQDFPRFPPLACPRIGVPERGRCERQATGKVDGALKGADGFVTPGRRYIGLTEHRVREQVAGIQLERLPALGDGIVKPSPEIQSPAQIRAKV